VEINIKLGIDWTGAVVGFCDNMIRNLSGFSAGPNLFFLHGLTAHLSTQPEPDPYATCLVKIHLTF
jgi:hypothetical protein